MTRDARFAEVDAIGQSLLDQVEAYSELVREVVTENAPSELQRKRLLSDVAYRATNARSHIQLLRVCAARTKGLSWVMDSASERRAS